MARTQFLDRELKLALKADFGPEAMAAELAKFSKQALAEYLATEEEPPGYVRYVNGREGAPEESVVAPGPIIYRFNWWPQILKFAMAFLRARSPTGGADGHKGRPTAYRDSFFVLAQGREKHPRQWSLIPPDEQVIITSDAPYHRKIDVQLMGDKPIRISVPDNIMENCADAIYDRFGDVVKTKRVYNTPHSGQWIYRRGPREGKPVNSPAIIVTPWG
jgi:hypothetical protein